MTGKRLMMIVNPRGGTRRGPTVLEAVRSIFDDSGTDLDVRTTTHAGHAGELARSMDQETYDGLCLIGGDGTIHEVVNGLMQLDDPSRTPLGIIPGGTGNTVLQHLGCLDPLEAARRIVAGNVQPLDVVQVQTHDELVYCVNMIGWGAAVDINRTAERWRAIGPPRYALAAASHILLSKWRGATLVLDDQVVEDQFAMIMACNTKFTGKGMNIAPRADHQDGKIDVIVVRKAARWQMFKLFNRVFQGTHVDLDCVEYHQVRSLAITPENRDLLNLDGELKCHTPLKAEILRAALQVFT